jgi:hypothetical protein
MPMTTLYLERITVKFPDMHVEFTHQLASLVDILGRAENHVLELTSSDQSFCPKIRPDFQSGPPDVLTDFAFSDGETISIKVENSTGLSKPSPHSYQPLDVETVNHRLMTSGVRLIGIDHVGFNLPWFFLGLHPVILQLRETLSSRCLYHQFPTGEPWDFIIPGDHGEIANRMAVDYTKVRRPKFELVSFNKASTPLIQLDVGVNASYERFAPLFPESLNEPEYRNIWIYLRNPYTVDVCLVINEFGAGDWSDYFKGCRL